MWTNRITCTGDMCPYLTVYRRPYTAVHTVIRIKTSATIIIWAGAGAEVTTTTTTNTATAAATAAPPRPTTAQKLRVRRSTFVPGWVVPPRVLLVDDDEVNWRMSSKFLQVFRCTIDVAIDGVGAVERMNLEKYDLVLKYGECFPGRRGNWVGAGLIFVVCGDRIS